MIALRRAAIGLSVLLAGGVAWSCGDPSDDIQALQITNRSQLVGGDRALGDVGDFLIENDRIRAVIQGPGYSRGFGVYGGSLIDVDLRRPFEEGTSGKPTGNDQFGEMFPAFFVQAVAVDRVSVINDGTKGGHAQIIAQGDAGDFIELAALLNRAVTGSNVDFQSLNSAPTIRYTTTYDVEPKKPWLTIRFKIENISSNPLKFPSDFSSQLLGLAGLDTTGFKVPLADIALFGATSKVWIPGIGFDSRFGLEDSYRKKVDFPAFPGVLAEFVASKSNGASYGLAVEGTDRAFVLSNKAIYDDGTTPIDKTTMLVPFSASSFLGIFHDTAPPVLAPHDNFEITKYFIVGSGDVGSVLDGFNQLRGFQVGTLGGQVFDTVTAVPSTGTTVIVYQRRDDGSLRIYSEYDVRENGSYGGTLVPGKYALRTAAPNRPLGALVDFEISANQTTSVPLTSIPPGRITVRIVDPNGHPLPAKSTAIGIYGQENSGKLTRQFLFDLQAGEPFRRTDMITDDPSDPETRKYVETVGYTGNGMATLLVRPGHYRVVSTRGPEYDVAATEVDVGPNETQSVTHLLTRVVDTTGWVSGDLHIHSKNSIDSSFDIDTRVQALAAEGVEWAVSTDHNFVTDYRPYVARNDLYPWIHAMVGVEMTTLESGHYNGYPLRYDPGPVTHGAFSWAGRPPGDIWNDIRGLGSLGPDRTIVQVNHPRDGILGYFSQYNRSSFTGEEEAQTLTQRVLAAKGPAFKNKDGSTTFSFDFDAMEVANGKLFYEIHNFRVPSTLPAGDLPANIPPTGMIVRKAGSGDPGFPGAADDWFNFLNTGKRFIAVGTADSHSGDDEAGQFHTWVFTGDDNPNALTDEGLIDAMRSRHVVASNAPLVDFYVDDPVKGVMGKTLQASGGQVTLHYTVTSAPWAGLTRLNFWRNGTIAKVVSVDPARNLASNPIAEQLALDLAKDASGNAIDTWFVIEALGNVSMFPAVTPQEVPPVLLTEAVATLAGPLGLGSDEFGALRPPEWYPVTPFAMTNPVWVTTHAGDWNPPGVVPEAVIDSAANDPGMFPYLYPQTTVRLPKVTHKAMTMSRPVERFEPRGKVPMFYPRRDNPFDVRKALSRYGHLGGHTE